MKDRKQILPPRWAQRFLEWYCKPELLEDLEGDLNECFYRNFKSKGPGRAKFIYIIDAVKFFRSYTVRQPDFINLLIHWIMLSSYIKTSGRSIVRNKLFSFINIFGLAVSMSIGLLTISFIHDLLSYDDFHEKKDRIYNVITLDQRLNEPPMTLASTSVKAARKIQETISGIEDLTVLRRGFEGDAVVGENSLPLSAFWADESFFRVFTFPLLKGDATTALKEPYSLVLTEKSAKKLFGETEALGKSVTFDTVNYIVTGVMKDVPKLSHIRFEALVSFSTVELQQPKDDGAFLNWDNIYWSYIYLVLPENGNSQTFQASLGKLCASENAGLKERTIQLSIRPLNEMSIGKSLSNPIGPTMNLIALWILGGLAAVIILSASFNYTNLSIARSLRRSREVGIRKVIGALKSHVLGQFISESVIISLLAFGFSFLMFLFLRTQFLSLHAFLDNLVSLKVTPTLVFYFIGLALLVGVVSGLLPALFFSRINAIQALKDVSSLKIFRHVTMRKALIVIQYTLSLIFITTTLIGYNQYRNFLTFDLGYSTENIVNIKMQGNKSDLLVKELSELPAISDISKSRIITSLGSMYGMQIKYNNAQDSAGVLLNFVDEHYIPLHNHKLTAGKNFNPRSNKEESEVIVNEKVLKDFNIGQKDPAKALGEQIIVDGKKLAIVGVLKDFHYGTMEDKIQPLIFRYSSDEPGGYINAKVNSKDLASVMASIETAWHKIDKVHPLEAKFYDDQIQEAYSQFTVMIKVIGFISFLAVCIASLGLFGMVVFTTETRLKEISIRKVLGATEKNLIFLLSKGFLFLLILSALVALPLTYLLFEKVVLINFAYHQPVGWFEMFIGAASVMIIAFLMIGSQTLNVARSNPAEVLKNE